MKIDSKEVLAPENAGKIEGGHKLIFCVTVELKQCATAEGKYCGTGKSGSVAVSAAHEIVGPVNPWG